MFNAHHEPLDFTLPVASWSRIWVKVFSTSEALFSDQEVRYTAAKPVPVEARALMLLRRI